MKLRSLLLGSAAAVITAGAVQAAPLPIVVEQATVAAGDVFKCGSGSTTGIMKPGTDWCYRWYGAYAFETVFGYELDYGDYPSDADRDGVGPADHPSWSGWGQDYGLNLLVTRMTPKGPIELRLPILDLVSGSSSLATTDSYRLRIGSTSANYWELAAGSSPYVQYRLRTTPFDVTWRVTDHTSSSGPLPDFRFILASRSGFSDWFSFETMVDWGQRDKTVPIALPPNAPDTNIWAISQEWSIDTGPFFLDGDFDIGVNDSDYFRNWNLAVAWGLTGDTATLTLDAVIGRQNWAGVPASGPNDLGFGAELALDFDPLGITTWGHWDRLDTGDSDNRDGSSSAWGAGVEFTLDSKWADWNWGVNFSHDAPGYTHSGPRYTGSGSDYNADSSDYTSYPYGYFYAGNYLEIFGGFEKDWNDEFSTEFDVSFNRGPGNGAAAATEGDRSLGISISHEWTPFDPLTFTLDIDSQWQLDAPNQLHGTNATFGFEFAF